MHPNAKIIETRIVQGGLQTGLRRRRRKCKHCSLVFTTYQRPGGDEVNVAIGSSQAHVAKALRDA